MVGEPMTGETAREPDTRPIEPVRIDVVSDVMCPWCFIGKRRLEKALAEASEVTAAVAWHPFQLDPTLPPRGKDRQRYLEEKFGGADQADAMYARVREIGAEEAIPFDFDRITLAPNTLNAHRVIRWAGIEGVQDAVVERLFALYFTEGADLTDTAVLSAAAGDAGLDTDVTGRLLAGDADLAETEADIIHARAIGVEGVPTFILDGKYAISGAQPAELLADAIRRVATERIDATA